MYRTLYSPTRASEWETTWANIPKFWEGITAESLVEKTRLVTGGAEHARDWRAMYAAIAAKTSPREAPIVIGDIAIKHTMGAGTNARLQIISAADIDKIVSTLVPLFGRKVIAIKYPLALPMDFQTAKYTIYAGEKIPICDVYNSSAFEIIPHEIASGVKYAAPFVLLRFKLIDYWLHRAIAKLTAGTSIVGVVQSLTALHKWTLGRTQEELFLNWKYTGDSINPAVARKKLAAELSDMRYPNYYPAKHAESDAADKKEQP
jgi:hypothetical protein